MTLQGSHGIFFYAQSVTAPPKDEPLQQGVSNVCFDDPRPGTMKSVLFSQPLRLCYVVVVVVVVVVSLWSIILCSLSSSIPSQSKPSERESKSEGEMTSSQLFRSIGGQGPPLGACRKPRHAMPQRQNGEGPFSDNFQLSQKPRIQANPAQHPRTADSTAD